MKNYLHYILLSMFLTTSTITVIAQDWPNLQRFQSENDSLHTLPSVDNRVVFMGNSITEGWDHHFPEFMAGKAYVNRGIGGQTTPQMLCRFRQDVIDLKPHSVVILAGTNDIAGNTGPSSNKMIIDNIMSMAELAHAHHIKVIICSIVPAYDYPWAEGKEPNIRIPAINAELKTYAEKNKFIYLDYFSKMEDGKNGLQKKYTYDGVHPDKKGYEVMAKLTESAIRKSFEKK